MRNNRSAPPHRDGLQRLRCGDATPGNAGIPAGRGGGREPARHTPEGEPAGYERRRVSIVEVGGRASREGLWWESRTETSTFIRPDPDQKLKRPARPGSQSRATAFSSRPSTFSDQIRPLMIEPRRNDRRRLARTLALRRAFEKSAISGLIGVELKWYRDPASQTRTTSVLLSGSGLRRHPEISSIRPNPSESTLFAQ